MRVLRPTAKLEVIDEGTYKHTLLINTYFYLHLIKSLV